MLTGYPLGYDPVKGLQLFVWSFFHLLHGKRCYLWMIAKRAGRYLIDPHQSAATITSCAERLPIEIERSGGVDTPRVKYRK
jgi:hypothetical protein